MKGFLIGVLATLVVLAVAGFLYLRLGYLDIRAGIHPSALESTLAMSFLDASTDRHARPQENPAAPTEANLLTGMKLYQQHCATCHGAPQQANGSLGLHFYPPAPQFTEDGPDMPEYQNFYIIQHGVRWTSMPAWTGLLDDQQIWQVTTFLAHMSKLPPAVDQRWRQAATQQPDPRPPVKSQRGDHE
jgi:mono/diheme cytochrome c family protein